jgi:hypothetical protein
LQSVSGIDLTAGPEPSPYSFALGPQSATSPAFLKMATAAATSSFDGGAVSASL